MKLSTKLLTLYLGMLLGVILPVLIFLYYNAVHTIEQQIRTHLQERAVHVMDTIDRFLFERYADIQVMVKDDIFRNHQDDLNRLTKRLLDYRNYYQVYAALSFYNAERIKIAGTENLAIGQQLPPYTWVKTVFEQEQISSGTKINSLGNSKTKQVFFAAPVKNDQGQITGAVVVHLAMENIHDILQAVETTHTAGHIDIDLINEQEEFLYSSHHEAGEQLSLEQKLADIAATDFYTLVTERGFLSFKGNQWRLLIHYPFDEAFAPVITLRNQIIFGSLLLVFFAIIGILLFARHIINPIRTVQKAALKLGNNDFTVRVPLFSNDEIGQLSKTFNQVASLLENQTRERQEIEQALIDSYERFREIVEGTSDLIVRLDSQGRFLYVNHVAKRILGITADDCGKLSIFDFVYPDDLEKTQAAFSQWCQPRDPYLKHSTHINFENRLVNRLTSKVFYMLWNIKIHTEQTGQVISLNAIAHDITERKQAEELLIILRKFAEGAGQGFGIATLTGQIIYANPALLRILGETALGKEVFVFYPAELVQRLQEEVLPAVMERGQWFGESTLCSETGKLTSVSENIFLIYDEIGTPIYIANIVTDITERKRTEAQLKERFDLALRFKAIADSTSDLVSYTDAQGHIAYVNPAGLAMVGRTEQKIASLDILDFHPPEIGNKITKEFLPIAQEKGIWSGETVLQHVDGTLISVSQVIVKMVDEQGEVIGFGTVMRDITERKRIEQQLKQAKEAAEAANQAKSVFLANMSHELRTPLNGILGYTQILQREKTLTPKQQEGIDIIQHSGDYLLTLINDILDLSKIEADKVELFPTAFNFHEFLHSLTELFQIRAQQKCITFIYEPLSFLPIGVYADEKRLRQVLINLLGNAIKFTEKGQVLFKVGYDEGKIRFQIEDTGTGIASEDLEKIFQPFQQVGDQSYKIEGTGLGLPITKKLLNMMDGELYVESTLGQGSVFWTRLTLPDASEAFIPAQKEPVEEPLIIGFEGATRRVLIIDDKWENRSVLVNLLEPLGFQIAEANNGKLGVEKAKAMIPDIILMDLVMPVMDGFEATRQIRSLPEFEDTPIIAISASAFDYHQQESFAAGCNDFLAKPFRVEALFAILQKQLALTWIYEQDDDQQAHFEENTSVEVPPSLEQAAVLFDLAMMGDIGGILDKMAEFEQTNKQLSHFFSRIRQLAKNFQEEDICNILQNYINSHEKQ